MSSCNHSDTIQNAPDIRLFYTVFNLDSKLNEPCIYDVKSGKSEKITIENYESVYLYDACGYSEGEFFAYYETIDECKILKVKNGKVVAVQDFKSEYKAPDDWEYGYKSIVSMERYKDGVLFLSPDIDPYSNKPFYADIPSTLYYTDFNGQCEPVLENIVSFKVYEDKICYQMFDKTTFDNYGNDDVYSKKNINIYENGEIRELFSSDNCSYWSVEDWCSDNELLLMKDGNIVKYNIETQTETVLLTDKFCYSFEEGNCRYISDGYILATSKKQDLITLNSDVSYLYIFDVESGRRTLVSKDITGTYDGPFEVIS